jgi:hypothetical protein
MARPTEYKKSYIAKANEYLAASEDEYTEFHKIRSNSDKSADGYDRLVRVNLPTIEGFALYIKHDTDTLLEWGKIYPEFSVALRKIKSIQKQRLISSGLSGDYSPVIAKLILSSNHGMRERQDITSDDKVLPVPLLQAMRQEPTPQKQPDVRDNDSNPQDSGND